MQRASSQSFDMNIRPIRTHEDYHAAMREAAGYFDQDPDPESPEGEHFEVLLTLIQAYEAKHFPELQGRNCRDSILNPTWPLFECGYCHHNCTARADRKIR
jgi:hypothetical protein